MVQAIDGSYFRPIYNGVNIEITKPKVMVNDCEDCNSMNCDNGIYNAVNIGIDNPIVKNGSRKKIYDYPQNNQVVTYDMLCTNQISIPTELLRPKVPAPNYTTVEAEKSLEAQKNESETEASDKDTTAVSFQAAPDDIKKPEIIPSEEIKPEVDIQQVVDNLTSNDYDVQAKQMEEIVKIAVENPAKATHYIVRDVMSSLIDDVQKDTSSLTPPSKEQVQARQKLILNVIAMQQNPNLQKLPYELSQEELNKANELSPMELAERNKEYALYTIAFLAKLYIDEVEKHTGNVVPMTDIPGASAMVEALRRNPNAGIKIAAIDSLKYISRPEYKEELSTIFEIAAHDKNPQVAKTAQSARQTLNTK